MVQAAGREMFREGFGPDWHIQAALPYICEIRVAARVAIESATSWPLCQKSMRYGELSN